MKEEKPYKSKMPPCPVCGGEAEASILGPSEKVSFFLPKDGFYERLACSHCTWERFYRIRKVESYG